MLTFEELGRNRKVLNKAQKFTVFKPPSQNTFLKFSIIINIYLKWGKLKMLIYFDSILYTTLRINAILAYINYWIIREEMFNRPLPEIAH